MDITLRPSDSAVAWVEMRKQEIGLYWNGRTSKEDSVFENLSMSADLRKIEVYGSHTKYVEADQAVLRFTVSGQHANPGTVMSWISRKSEEVETALKAWDVADVKSSRAKLSRRTRKVKDKTAAFEDYYTTSVQYWVTTPEIESVKDIQLKLVELGVTEICPTVFTVSSLKRHYSEVRRKAMKAALDKAELYCKEAGARVGPPITIRDLNSDSAEAQNLSHDSSGCGSDRQPADGEVRTSGPELVPVVGSLQVVFEILVGAYVN